MSKTRAIAFWSPLADVREPSPVATIGVVSEVFGDREEIRKLRSY